MDGGPGEGQNRRRQVRKLEGKEIGTSRGNYGKLEIDMIQVEKKGGQNRIERKIYRRVHHCLLNKFQRRTRVPGVRVRNACRAER